MDHGCGGAGTASILQWASTSKGEQFDTMGLRFTITHKRPVEQVTWHHKGNYIATVIPTGLTEAVFIHAMQRQTSQNPFSKTKAREVQRVIFHPVQPIFFVAVGNLFNLADILLWCFCPACMYASQHVDPDFQCTVTLFFYLFYFFCFPTEQNPRASLQSPDTDPC